MQLLHRLKELEGVVEALRIEVDALKTALESRKRDREMSALAAGSVEPEVVAKTKGWRKRLEAANG